MKRLLFLIFAVFCGSAMIYAQPRPMDKAPTLAMRNLPASFKARYEGGIFGSSGKENGTLKFDDANERVVFYRKDGKEMFSIPFAALLIVYPDSKEHVSKTGNIISRLPLPGAGLAGLKSSSSKYLNITFDDPDVDAKGTANFKFDNKELLLTFIDALGAKAKMKRRGEAFYRPRDESGDGSN